MQAALSHHPFAPVVDGDCRVLVLGSHPSVQSKLQGFYYMHPQNRFWRVMGHLFDVDFVGADIEGKRRMLLAHHVALYDVISRCTVSGSSDASIRDVVPTDIEALLAGTHIDHIFLNGATAYKYFCRYHPQYLTIATMLPSTSAANARYRLPDLVAEWRVVAQTIEDNL